MSTGCHGRCILNYSSFFLPILGSKRENNKPTNTAATASVLHIAKQFQWSCTPNNAERLEYGGRWRHGKENVLTIEERRGRPLITVFFTIASSAHTWPLVDLSRTQIILWSLFCLRITISKITHTTLIVYSDSQSRYLFFFINIFKSYFKPTSITHQLEINIFFTIEMNNNIKKIATVKADSATAQDASTISRRNNESQLSKTWFNQVVWYHWKKYYMAFRVTIKKAIDNEECLELFKKKWSLRDFVRGSRGPSTVTFIALLYVVTWIGDELTIIDRVKLLPAKINEKLSSMCWASFQSNRTTVHTMLLLYITKWFIVNAQNHTTNISFRIE